MQLLVNENISSSVIAELRSLGHDVLSAKESMRGDPDEKLLARAQVEGRLLVTHDKDFGELSFRANLPANCGVVLFRLEGEDPTADTARVVEVLDSRDDWSGHFSVVTPSRIRMRPLQPNAPKPK